MVGGELGEDIFIYVIRDYLVFMGVYKLGIVCLK